MNKYEILFQEIIQQTEAGILSWKQIERQSNADIIYKPYQVFRQFSADFTRSGADFKLFLIEKKCDDPEADSGYRDIAPEILVVDERGELVTTLTDSVISHSGLIRLADTVGVRNDNVARLFAASA